MIKANVMQILKDQELFRTVTICDAKYTVIYHSANGIRLIIKSEGYDESLSGACQGTLFLRKLPEITVNLYMPTGDVAVGWALCGRRREGSKYMVCQAIKWFDTPESPKLSLAIPEEITDIDIERSLLALFVGHLEECEDRFAFWPTLKTLS